ncbi:hypothetical protein HQ585_13215 [candidate division KSB1 bacterium]|nr:hypothetical protein [candidate division KSB1 bacterium]
MKNKVLLVLTGAIFIALLTSGCYTVVMIPSSSNNTTSYDEEYSDAEYDAYYENDSSSQVVNKYYISGGCYYGFDPFYASPYWYHYSYDWRFSTYDPWYWNSWPYYGGQSAYFMYNPGYYYPPGYYSDPYYSWYGYNSPEPYGRRQFERRDRVLAGDRSNSPVSSSSDRVGTSRSIGLSSRPVSPGSRVRDGQSASSSKRGIGTRTPSGNSTRSPSPTRVRSGSSGSSKSRPAGSSTQGRKTSKPSSSRVRSGSSSGSSSSGSSGSSSSGSSNRSGGRRSR